MFSLKEKKHIAYEIEKLLLELKHPEMPDSKPQFHLRVDGKESWSFAEIDPNWKFDNNNKPSVNAWNEVAREVLKGE